MKLGFWRLRLPATDPGRTDRHCPALWVQGIEFRTSGSISTASSRGLRGRPQPGAAAFWLMPGSRPLACPPACASTPPTRAHTCPSVRRYGSMWSWPRRSALPVSAPLATNCPRERRRTPRGSAPGGESYAAVDEWAAQHGVTVLVKPTQHAPTGPGRLWTTRRPEPGRPLAIFHHVSRGQSVDAAYGYLRGLVRHVHFAITDDAADADQQRHGSSPGPGRLPGLPRSRSSTPGTRPGSSGCTSTSTDSTCRDRTPRPARVGGRRVIATTADGYR